MSSIKLTLIQQGAEARILLDEAKGEIIKDRIPKSYRIKELDDKIRRVRTRSEAKLLVKASQIINVPIPALTNNKLIRKEVITNSPKGGRWGIVQKNNFQITMPFIDGKKLSEHLDELLLERQKQILKQIGRDVAKLHDANIIHGDLTTSNMILVEDCTFNKLDEDNKENPFKQISKLKKGDNKPIKEKEVISNILPKGGGAGMLGNNFKIFFIDFGLGFFNGKYEDKAVDIHLLKQALEAKHFKHWQKLYESFLEGYRNSKDYEKILNQLNKVERRGRYRH